MSMESYLTLAEYADLPPTPDDPMSEAELLRWRACVRPLPMPAHQVPVSGAPLQDVSDDVLMDLPPHLIVHMQRTAAQGGMQVVSPRQTPFSALMLRTPGGRRQVGDHVVGSVANPGLEWPTVLPNDLDRLLPDEPLPYDDESKALRVKTRTTPLTQAGRHLSDPIVSCLIKGRAVIDLLRRDDVMGGADEFTEVLAAAWGIPSAEIKDLDAFTLGVDGPLLRHAIKTDEVYATYYAPTHVRRCVSVGSSQMTRHYLPSDSAMDWSRMRTHCEAVFVMACSIEGLPIRLMRSPYPPGDPSAASNRPNVMCFLPTPTSAWTFSADTFSIYPSSVSCMRRASAIPHDVLASLSRYVQLVKPMSYALTTGYKARARKTTVASVPNHRGETIADSYRLMVMTVSLGSARGKIAAAAIRNAIYTALENADLSVRLRLVRYIKIANEECCVHLGLKEVPDRVIAKLCDRFLRVGEIIRLQVASEAARRGHTVEEWWADITAQTPERYRMFSEGTRGWALVGLWLLFRSPTDRWSKLVSALHYSALREAEVSGIGKVQLPAEKGSRERLLAAARAAIKSLCRAYCGYYSGVSDVGMVLGDVADDMGRGRTADVLREAAYLWMLRARALRGTNIELVAKDKATPSLNHFRVIASPVDLLVVPAPYRAYEAYKTHALESPVLRDGYKRHLRDCEKTRLSDIFVECRSPAYHVVETQLTRYMLKPHELGVDMERAWEMLVQDLYEVASIYGSSERSRSQSPSRKRGKTMASEQVYVPPPAPNSPNISYWDLTADMQTDQVEWVEDVLTKMGTEVEDMFLERMFVDRNDMVQQLLDMESSLPGGSMRKADLVR